MVGNPSSFQLAGPLFGKDKISSQEATYSLQFELIEWERKARKA